MSEERAIFHAKPHWFYLARPGCLILFGLPFVIVGLTYGMFQAAPEQVDSAVLIGNGLMMFGGFFFTVALLVLVVVSLGYRAWDFYVTDRRVILKSGVLKRKVKELVLRQIQSVHVDSGRLGRWLKFGTVVVEGADGIRIPVVWVEKPDEVRQVINAARSMPRPSSGITHCSHCGQTNASMAKYCRGCGSEF